MGLLCLSWQIIVLYFATNDIFTNFVAEYNTIDMKENIIGREQEKTLLSNILQSGKPEFVAICGRRRVGKTFLVKEFYEKDIIFQTAGLAKEGMRRQIKSFYEDLLEYGLPQQSERPKDWIEIFSLLRSLIKQSDKERKVILLDELPWMDTARSGFVSALEHFWNSWASGRHDIILVVCGSSTSWMMDKLINNHGGLHNRLTHRIFLTPFTLRESELFLQSKGFILSRYDIAVYYMIMGGIPYYLDMLDTRMSLSQNIDNLMFRLNGALAHEFPNLYAALFQNSDAYIKIVETLSRKKIGLSRSEIIQATGMESGNGLTTILHNLEWCGFIRQYKQYKAARKESILYQLTDFFTLFHFRFLNDKKVTNWLSIQGKPTFHTWAGLTFELLVLDHIEQMKQRLGIHGIATREYAWRCTDSEQGAQIDLVVERADNTMNLCEIKFCIAPYTIDKTYEMNLRNKLAKLATESGKRKSIQLTFVSTYGLLPNAHSGIVNNEVLLDDLFREG